MSAPATWVESVQPLVAKLAMHRVTEQPASLSPEAAGIVAKMLHDMAMKLDANGIPPDGAA